MKHCPTCQRAFPEGAIVEKGMNVPCTPYHVRCVECMWPVVNSPKFVDSEGVCRQCRLDDAKNEKYSKSKVKNKNKVGVFTPKLVNE